MASEKVKVTLYLRKDMYARARSLAQRLPNASVSAMVEEAMDGFLPALEQLVDLKDQGRDAQVKAWGDLLGRQFVELAEEGVETIRKVKEKADK
jgi:hypothetical protein